MAEHASRSNSAADLPSVVSEQPAARPGAFRVSDAFLDGRIEEGDDRQNRIEEVVREATWRREGRRRFYVVGVGRHPGVCLTPKDCNRQIMGYSGNRAQLFASRIDAELFVQQFARRQANDVARERVYQAVREVLEE